MTEYVISTMEDTNNVILSVADKVRDIDSLSEWWVLTLYPELDSVICITTDESRKTRKTFKPHQLEILEGMP